MIAWSIYITIIGALVTLAMPARLSRWIALLTAVAGSGVTFAALAQYATASQPSFSSIVDVAWIPSLKIPIHYHLAVDGISLALTLVTGLTAIGAVLMSWNVERRANEFFFWMLLVIVGSYGVFLSADLFLFIVFYELVIVPKFFLIATWGSTNKAYGAMKLTLYSFLGGAMVIITLIAAVLQAHTTDLITLGNFAFTPELQVWAFPVMFLGFAILAGIWPFHTWAPTGHVAAPTAGSMLLAGVVMKLGAYGALRVAINLFPQGFHQWRGAFAILALIGICYAAGVALRQRDLKFVIGYSSVSHMGFVLLGLCTAQVIGSGGAVLQMFSHGIVAGLLFSVVGRMIYERTHTRDLPALATMGLSKAIPFASFTFVIASAASMGLPGFSGFPAEIGILMGLWKSYPWMIWIAGSGMVLTAAFTLRALKLSFFAGDAHAGIAADGHHVLEPISFAEKLGGSLLMLSALVIGLCPNLLLDRILPSIEAMRWIKQ
jgi:NADH-quinone oxidoreductase subunit M